MEAITRKRVEDLRCLAQKLAAGVPATHEGESYFNEVVKILDEKVLFDWTEGAPANLMKMMTTLPDIQNQFGLGRMRAIYANNNVAEKKAVLPLAHNFSMDALKLLEDAYAEYKATYGY